jgi:hypothetical protein
MAYMTSIIHKPYAAMGRECKPCLNKDCDNAGPIEHKIISKVMLHIMPPNMVYDEWKGVQESKDKEGIGYPSVENLKSLVGDASKQCNPIRFARSCTISSKHSESFAVFNLLTTQMAYMPGSSIRIWWPVLANYHRFRLANNKAVESNPYLLED